MSQSLSLEARVRRRIYHSISQDTANVIGARQEDLQLFIAKQITFTEEQLVCLARYLGIK